MGEGTRRTSSFIPWTVGIHKKLLSRTQRKLRPLASVWKEQRPLGEHPAVRGEAFLLWLLCQAWLRAMTLRCFQQQADSHSMSIASSQSWSWKGHGPVLPGPGDRDELARPAGACLRKTSSSALPRQPLSSLLPLPS